MVGKPAPAVPAHSTSKTTVAARRAHVIGTQDSSNRRSHEEISGSVAEDRANPLVLGERRVALNHAHASAARQDAAHHRLTELGGMRRARAETARAFRGGLERGT